MVPVSGAIFQQETPGSEAPDLEAPGWEGTGWEGLFVGVWHFVSVSSTCGLLIKLEPQIF